MMCEIVKELTKSQTFLVLYYTSRKLVLCMRKLLIKYDILKYIDKSLNHLNVRDINSITVCFRAYQRD